MFWCFTFIDFESKHVSVSDISELVSWICCKNACIELELDISQSKPNDRIDAPTCSSCFESGDGWRLRIAFSGYLP